MSQPVHSQLASHPDLLEKVAHDLRGPAGVTLGALDELCLSIGQSGEHTQLIEMAQRGIKKILRTAERISRLARLSAGQQASLSPTDFTRLLREVCTEVGFLEGRRTVTFAPELPADAVRVLADEPWLRALVGELLTQALRSAKSSVSVAVSRADGHIVLSVRDDGAVGERAKLLEAAPGEAQGEQALRSDPVFALRLAADIAKMHGAALELVPEAAPGLSVRLKMAAA